MKKTLSLFVITAILLSCADTSSKTTANKPAPVDSLIANWSNSWSNHDSAGVSNLFLADALLIDDDLIATNTAEISNKWIQPNINVVSHFKTTSLQSWSTNDRAGYTGKYEFDVVVKDSVVARSKGLYTVNWIKTDKGEWKINIATIHSLEEKIK